MGYQFCGKFFLERGANLESQAAHAHPKNTQVPLPRGHSLDDSPDAVHIAKPLDFQGNPWAVYQKYYMGMSMGNSSVLKHRSSFS